MKKFITTILAIVFLLTGCDGVTENNSSNDISNDISSEESTESAESVESSESSESSDTSSESSEASDSSEESSENISSEVSSEEPYEDISSEESREEDPSSQPDSSEEEKNDDNSSPVVPEPPAPPVSGGDNGNESKPEEDTSSAPVESEPEKDESKVEDVSSAPDVSEPDEPVAHIHSYTAKVKAATCTAEGYTEYTCECGDSYKADYTAKTEHQWGPWFMVTQATTMHDGARERGCTICYNWETEVIPKIVITITQEDLDFMAEVGLEYLNSRRAEKGLQPLVTGPIAHQMASERAVQLSEYFSHELPNGYIGSWEVFAKYKYNLESVDGDFMPELGGEDIAKSSIGNADSLIDKENAIRLEARNMISGFEMSPGHWYDLMDDRYTACGIGYYIEILDEGGYNIFICVLTMDKLYGTDAQ